MVRSDAASIGSATLSTARRKNAERQITGALLLDQGQFIQVLEGERETIETCFAKIGRDKRHDEVQLLALTPLSARRFNHWSMAYLGSRKLRSNALGVSVTELRCLETARATSVLNAMLDLAQTGAEDDAL